MIKSAISFGLVYIPVTLNLVIKNNDIGFNMLHKKYNSRIRYIKTCPECDGEVQASDIVKGYEYDDDQYVTFDNDDFEKLKSKKDKTITILQFADLKDIDPIYYEKSYYVSPNGAEQAYSLLVNAMQKENKVAIAKSILGTKESLIVIRAKDGSLVMSTMYFFEEVQANPTKAVKAPAKNSEEYKLALNIIKSMTKPFKASDYKDEYHERLLNAIQTKINGKQIKQVVSNRPPNVINLLDALKKSLKEQEKAEEKPKIRRVKWK